MATLVILSGPSAIGKTSYARGWQSQGGILVGSMDEAIKALREGKDVVLDQEGLYAHHIEVKRFIYDERAV